MPDQLGCSTNAENGEIQVIQNSALIIKEVRRNDLYILFGSLSLLGIITTMTNDKTKSWNMRFSTHE